MISPLIARLAASVRLDATSPVAKIGRIAVQSAGIAAVWFAADYVVRRFGLPVPGGVVGLGGELLGNFAQADTAEARAQYRGSREGQPRGLIFVAFFGQSGLKRDSSIFRFFLMSL